MDKCIRLFAAENIAAYYDSNQKLVVVSADVTIGPADDVHICPNPLARIVPPPELPEFIVEGTTRPGIHPMIVYKRTIAHSFAAETPPAKVRVFSRGVDNPAIADVLVGTKPPVMANATAEPAAQGQPAAQRGAGPYEAMGWSADFKFDDAFADAVTNLRKIVPMGNPDIPLAARVVEIGSVSGGFTQQHGMFVKVSTRNEPR